MATETLLEEEKIVTEEDVSAAPDYAIDYNDERFQKVESSKDTALKEMDDAYNSMIDKTDSFYQSQIDASKQWADKQSQLQQEKSDFAIQQVEQNKAQAQKDYTKEQSGAYADWQKQSGQYGVNAEQMAAQGMRNSGYSESAQVAMYTAYQNRVATARESYVKAIQNYDNAITEARLQNNSLLAEIAYNALQQQLELSLQGFQYNNQLVLDKTKQKLEVENMYYNRYQDVLAQINQENALAEEIRQFNILHPQEESNAVKGVGGGGYYSSGSSKKSSSGSSKSSSGSKSSSSGSSTVAKSSSSSSSKSSSGSNELTIDTKSVLAAGLGPASEQTIANAAKSGKVTVVQKGNTLVVNKNKTTTPVVGFTGSNFEDYMNYKTQTTNKKTTTTKKTTTGGKNAASNKKYQLN